MKKGNVLIGLFLLASLYPHDFYGWSLFPQAPSSMPVDPKDVEKAAEALGVGFFRGIGKNLGSMTQEDAQEFVQKIFAGALKGFGEGISKEIGSAAHGLERATADLTGGLGKGLKEATAKDAPFTVGMDQMAGVVSDFYRKAFLNNYRKFVGYSLAGSSLYFVAKYGIPFMFSRIEHMLNTPQLIIESSRKSIQQRVMDFFMPQQDEAVQLVFEPNVEGRLNSIVKGVQNTNKRIVNEKKTNVFYRNLLLYGSPGTGKTAFARELAKRSGMEWAMMSGSSFAKFKEGEGIEALDKLFAWADSAQGLLLFIDEADSFLGKREKMDPNAMSYKLLNNFLNYTGAPSRKFMIVFATNHKANLDSAMYERIHDYVHIPLPNYNERIRILNLYAKRVLLNEKENGKPFVESVKKYLTTKKIEEIAAATEGFAGRGLQVLINAIQTSANISDAGLVSPQIIDAAVAQAVEKYNDLRE